MRNVIFSTTVFLYHEDEYLMMHRTGNVSVDNNKLNGIGGKLEEGENYLHAAIRETKEETGYMVHESDITFSGLIKLHGGYPDDWVMCFFKANVSTKEIPHGNSMREGELLWLHKDNVLNSGYELVDDLHYVWEYIVHNKVFFATTEVGEDEKVKKISISFFNTYCCPSRLLSACGTCGGTCP
jgi:8-oxo-dGTP pyrophosphatase MutT (NUDIX family)